MSTARLQLRRVAPSRRRLLHYLSVKNMRRQPCFTVQTWFVGLLFAATASAGRAEVGVFSSAASPWGPQLAAALTAGLEGRGVAVTASDDRTATALLQRLI